MSPTITNISPAQGPEQGGTIVTITGSGFLTNGEKLATVKFGSNAAVTCNVDSDTQITALTPAGTGRLNVTVWTLFGGASASSAISQYEFVKPPPGMPDVTGVSPNAGPLEGGVDVDITGTGLAAVTTIQFGPMAVLPTNIIDDNHIVATSPALADGYEAGTVHITIVTPLGTSTATVADEFTYQALPVITALDPANGSSAGGDAITISGTNLGGVTEVWFGDVQAFGVVVDGDSSISVFAPEGVSGSVVDVVLVSPGGVSETSSATQFTYDGDETLPVNSIDGRLLLLGAYNTPLSNVPCRVTVADEVVFEGRSDETGYVTCEALISATVCNVEWTDWLEAPDGEYKFSQEVRLAFDDGDNGVLQRLENLGYRDAETLEAAVLAYQADNGLAQTGVPDDIAADLRITVDGLQPRRIEETSNELFVSSENGP